MPIPLKCRACLTAVRVPRRMAGRGFCCPMCGKLNVVPATPPEASAVPTRKGSPTSAVATFRAMCPKCRTRIKVTAHAPLTDSSPVSTRAFITLPCCTCGVVVQAAAQRRPVRRGKSSREPGGGSRTVVRPALETGWHSHLPPPAAELPDLSEPVGIDKQAAVATTAECATRRSRTYPASRPPSSPVLPTRTPESNDSEPPPIWTPREEGIPFHAIALILSGVGLALALVGFVGLGLTGSGLGVLLGAVALVRNLLHGHGVRLALAGAALGSLTLLGALLMSGEESVADRVIILPWPPEAGGKPTPADPEEWVDAKNALQLGLAVLRLNRAAMSWEPVKLGRPKQPRCLSLFLRIDNVGRRRTLTYTNWAGGQQGTPPMVRLLDDAGTEHPLLSLNDQFIPGGNPPDPSLRPGYYVHDVLHFKPPRLTARSLRLELSGRAFGQAGQWRLTIPKEMIDLGPP